MNLGKLSAYYAGLFEVTGREEYLGVVGLLREPYGKDVLVAALQSDTHEKRVAAAMGLKENSWLPKSVLDIIRMHAALKDVDALIATGQSDSLVEVFTSDLFLPGPSKVAILKALAKLDPKSMIPLAKTQLYSWWTGQQAVILLYSLGWQPETEEEVIYAYIAERSHGDILRGELRPQTFKLLTRNMDSETKRIRQSAWFALTALGYKEVLPIMAEKIDSIYQARLLLCSGNPEARKIGAGWAEENGYDVVRTAIPILDWGALK
nr:hypothetical protein [uncultured Pseudodesulfovibrio sp.]